MIVHTNLARLPGLLKRDAQRLEKAIKRAVGETAVKAAAPIRKRVPKAFGELQESILGHPGNEFGDDPITLAAAPHAAAVEIGSRPHKPDFRRLVEWVRLRGMQGLTARGRIRKRFRAADGPTTPRQARRVASMFKKLEVRGKSTRGRAYKPGSLGKFGKPAVASRQIHGRHSPIDAPEQIARAISKGIEEKGTPPHWYVRDSLPEIRDILDKQIRQRVLKK